MDFNNYIPTFLSGNQYFSAGFGLVGVGTALTLLQRTGRAGIVALKNRITATLEITNSDPSYSWILSWLTSKGIKTKQLSVQTLQKIGHDGMCSNQFVLVPSTGKHWFFYDGIPIIIHRNRDKMTDSNHTTPFESITLKSFSRSVFDKILEEAYQYSITQSSGYTIIYKAYNYEWRPIGHPKKNRPLNSVILAPGLSNHLVNDFKRFISSQEWYHSIGIPHRRCYLLYGPPGCGKTSFVSAIAGHFNYDICTLNIGDGLLSDDRLFHLLSVMPVKTILLLEDIDGGIAEGKNGITYAGLLNALDGVVSTEERLIFMTTNHLDKLPKTLIRPGRVDVMVPISYPNDQQVKDLFMKFYPECQELANKMAEILSPIEFSMAELQSLLMYHRESPERAIESATKWAGVT